MAFNFFLHPARSDPVFPFEQYTCGRLKNRRAEKCWQHQNTTEIETEIKAKEKKIFSAKKKNNK